MQVHVLEVIDMNISLLLVASELFISIVVLVVLLSTFSAITTINTACTETEKYQHNMIHTILKISQLRDVKHSSQAFISRAEQIAPL